MLNNMKKTKAITVGFFIFIGVVGDILADDVIGANNVVDTSDNIDTGNNKKTPMTSTIKTVGYKNDIILSKQAPIFINALVFCGDEQSDPEWIWDTPSFKENKDNGDVNSFTKAHNQMSYEEYFSVDRRLMEIKSGIDNEINGAKKNEPLKVTLHLSNDPNLTEGKHTALIQNNTYGNEELTSQDNNEFNHSVFKADIEINNLNNHEVYEEAFDWGASRRASNSSLTSLLDDTAENIDYESAALLLEQQWDVFNNDVYEELETKINDIDSFNLSSTTNDGDASGAGSTTNDGDASGAGSTTSDGDASGAGSTTSDGDASGAGSTSSDGGTDEGDTTAIMDAVQEQDETVITESEVLADPRLAPEPCDFFIPQPQAGIYIANLSAANTMFAHRMHDRIGEPTFPATFGDLADGIQPAMWLRVGGGRNTTQVRKGQLETSTSMGLVHGGGELVNWHVNGNDSLHLGVMFGAGKSHSHSHVADTGLLATGHVEGYSTGIYATWHQHDNTHQGLYVDGSLSYNWFVNQVDTPMSATKGIAGNAHAYRSRGFIGSLESGYNWNIFSGERVDAYLQPQMQITWLGVKAHIDGDNNGERLDMLGNDRVQTRLGTRLFLRGYASRDSGKQRMFQPYVEASWLHNNQAYGVRLNHETYRQDGTRNIGEIRMGNDGQINQHLALWGNVTQQIGDDGFHETLGTLGIKVNF